MKTMVLDITALTNLSRNSKAVEKFPMFQALASIEKPTGCRCKHKPNPSMSRAIADVKEQIVSLPPERQIELKKLLKVDAVVVNRVNQKPYRF